MSVITVFSLFLHGRALYGQTPNDITWIQRDSIRIGYLVNSNQDTLKANTQFSVDLYIECQSGASGQGFWIDLETDVWIEENENKPDKLPQQSWLGTPADLDPSHTTITGNGIVSMSVQRKDSVARSGSGKVLSTHFVVGSEPVLASDVIRSLDGGLIVLDNLDMRLIASEMDEEEMEPLRIWPNPCRDWIMVNQAKTANAKVRVLDPAGHFVANLQAGMDGRVDVSGLMPGMYLIQVVVDGAGTGEFVRLSKL